MVIVNYNYYSQYSHTSCGTLKFHGSHVKNR